MSDDRDDTVATAATTSDEKIEEKTPVTNAVRAGTEIRTITEADWLAVRRATVRPGQRHALIR
jgi:hypothetical protein